MALSVNISGDTSIDQGGQTTLTAVVMDAEGNTITSGLTYSWNASRGSFDGVINQASAVYDADFTDAMDVDVTITCRVTRAGDASPTVSASSLTALVDLGISGILVNIHATDTDAVAANTNNILFQEGTVGTIEAGSDLDLSATLRIYRVRWDNRSGNSRLILNNNGTGSLNTYFSGNTAQSIYLIFEDGTYIEIDNSQYGAGGGSFARWDLTEQSVIDALNDWDGTENLLVGIADAGSVGITADSGSDTETVTASAVVPLSIEQIDEQFITLGTEDYDLVIDVGGDPDDVFPSGHIEGFTHHWDAANGRLHIKSDEVTRLIAGVHWNVEAVKGMQNLMGQIAYNVVRAAPIFQTLATIHLYRGVDINFDILIQNIPPLLIPNAYLMGLKSELLEYGINVKGRMETADNFTFTSGNIEIIVPSEREGEADTVHEYPFEIESGSPPQIVSPKFTPYGTFGELEFPDVTHALGYEWTRETGDDAVWNLFSDARNVINPREVEVTPGNLNVTIKLPNVNNASAYEYQLESENHEVEWTRFTGTLSNNMITTIIPGLIEGEEYTLRLRVASPWMGPPIEVTVFGGRFAYALHEDRDSTDNHVLYVFHTGTRQSAVARIIKRILIPDDIDDPADLAVDFENNLFYIADHSDHSVHVFSLNTGHDVEATRLRKFFKPSTLSRLYSLSFYDGVLYGTRFDGADIASFAASTPDGQVAVEINHYNTNITDGGNSRTYAADASEDLLYYTNAPAITFGFYIVAFPRTPVDYSDTDSALNQRLSSPIIIGENQGLSVIGDVAYLNNTVSNNQRIYLVDITKTSTDDEQIIRWFLAPPGCNRIVGLVVEK